MVEASSEPSSSNYVHIFPDYSALIYTQFAKVAVNRGSDECFSFFHDKSKTYCLVSITCSLANWDGNGSLHDLFENCTDLLTLIKLKSDIVGFLYSTSGMSARTLLHKCSEAKQLFSLESVQSSVESLNGTGYRPKGGRTLSEEWEVKGSEVSESFEYSVTSFSQLSFNEDFVSLNTFGTEENKAESYNEPSFDLEFPEAHTPEANFKQFEMPTARLKLLFKLQESQLNSTSPFSVDSEKAPSSLSDIFQAKSPDSQKCLNCEKCVIS